MSFRPLLPISAAAGLITAVLFVFQRNPEHARGSITAAHAGAKSPAPSTFLHPSPDAIPRERADRPAPAHFSKTNSAAPLEALPLVSAATETVLPIPVDPAAPGNTLATRGVRIDVTASRMTADGPELSVMISDEPAARRAAGVAAAASPDIESAASPTVVPQQISATGNSLSALRDGLTAEEELFRTKWGWDAYARVQRAGAEDAASQH